MVAESKFKIHFNNRIKDEIKIVYIQDLLGLSF